MPIKREYKCQIIFQTAANVTQIAKIQQQQQQKQQRQKVPKNKSYSTRAATTATIPKKREERRNSIFAEYALGRKEIFLS